jgi:hypothetical protein
MRWRATPAHDHGDAERHGRRGPRDDRGCNDDIRCRDGHLHQNAARRPDTGVTVATRWRREARLMGP